MTSASASLHYAERLRAAGRPVARFELDGAGHALLDQPFLWHRFAVTVPLGLVGDRELPAAVVSALCGPVGSGRTPRCRWPASQHADPGSDGSDALTSVTLKSLLAT